MEKLTKVGLLYGIPSGIHTVYGECTCDNNVPYGKQIMLQLSNKAGLFILLPM